MTHPIDQDATSRRRRPGTPRRGRRRQTRQQIAHEVSNDEPRSIRVDDPSVQVIGHRMAYRVARNLSSGHNAPNSNDHIAHVLRTAGACAFWALAGLTLIAVLTTSVG